MWSLYFVFYVTVTRVNNALHFSAVLYFIFHSILYANYSFSFFPSSYLSSSSFSSPFFSLSSSFLFVFSFFSQHGYTPLMHAALYGTIDTVKLLLCMGADIHATTAVRKNINHVMWYNVKWYDMMWNDMMWNDMMWCDKMWNEIMWCDKMWNEMMWNDMMWNEMMWCDKMWNDVMWYDLISNVVKWRDMVWNQIMCTGCDWFGSATLGLVYLSLLSCPHNFTLRRLCWSVRDYPTDIICCLRPIDSFLRTFNITNENLSCITSL